MGAFEDFVNLELPKRTVMFTASNTGYTGDPNLSVLPELNLAPQGSLFIDDTGPLYRLYYKREQFVSTSWAEGGGGGSTLPIDVYVSSAGSDSNSGTVGDPVATWARVWEIATSTDVTVHLEGTVSGYVAPPPSIESLAITGDDNYTVVATGVAGASTDSHQLELAVAGLEDEYRHFTVRFTTGAAVGYLRSVRNNSTTIVVPVTPFENHGALVVPAPGDTYEILRPSAKIEGTAVVAGTTYRTLILSEFARVDLINVAIEGDNPSSWFYNFIQAAPGGFFFGVLVEGDWNIDSVFGGIVSGADNTDTVAAVEALTTKLGVAGYVSGQWHGWCLSFENATFFQSGVGRLGYRPRIGKKGVGFFYGFITAGTFYSLSDSNLLGGSFGNMFVEHGDLHLFVSNVQLSFSFDAIMLLIKGGVGYTISPVSIGRGGSMTVGYSFQAKNRSIEIEYSGSTTAGIFSVSGYLGMSSGFGVVYTGAANCPVFRCRSPGGAVNYIADGSGGIQPWTMGNGSLLSASAGATVSIQTFNMTGASGVVNDGADVLIEFDGNDTPSCIVTGQVWLQSSGKGTVRECVLTGDAPALIEIKGGEFSQRTNSMVATNNATGANDVLRIGSGAVAQLTGSSFTQLDGSAGASGYGINARGGGRVYFLTSAPTFVVGATADISVGEGTDEDQADSFFDTYGALVSADTLSSVALAAGGPVFAPAAQVDVYLATTGDDTNTGLSLGAPVATWARVWQVVARGGAPVVVHLLDQVNGYEAPPGNLPWVILSGDANVNVLASGVAGAATTDVALELDTAATVNEFWGKTLRFTTGAAAGYLRTIRDNTTTICTPVQAFDNFSGAVSPAPGDSYEIFEPSLSIVGAPKIANQWSMFNLSQAETRLDIYNLGIAPTNVGTTFDSSRINGGRTGMWFGVKTEGAWLIGSGELIVGVDNDDTYSDVLAIAEALGIVGHVSGQWNGYAVNCSGATLGATNFTEWRPGYIGQDGVPSSYYGYFTGGTFKVNGHARLLGGSGTILETQTPGSHIVLQYEATSKDNFVGPVIPYLLDQNVSGLAVYMNESTFVTIKRPQPNGSRIALQIRATASVSSSGVIRVGNQAQFVSTGAFDVDHTGTGGPFWNCGQAARLFYQQSTGILSMPNMSLAVCFEGGHLILSNGAGLAHVSGILNAGGKVNLITMGGTFDDYVIQQLSGTTEVTSIAANFKGTIGTDIRAGDFTVIAGTYNSNYVGLAGPATNLRVRAGARAALLDPQLIDAVATATSGYAINARGGGRVYIEDASNCVGTTADLTVGTGGGEDQSNAFLAVSESALVSGSTLSSIARST